MWKKRSKVTTQKRTMLTSHFHLPKRTIYECYLNDQNNVFHQQSFEGFIILHIVADMLRYDELFKVTQDCKEPAELVNESEIKVAQYITEFPDKQWFADKLHKAIELTKYQKKN